MSYILEALKRSQQERELGRVPTLASAPFPETASATRGTPWVLLALALALLAILIALYAALGTRPWSDEHEVATRGEASPPAPKSAAPVPPATPGVALQTPDAAGGTLSPPAKTPPRATAPTPPGTETRPGVPPKPERTVAVNPARSAPASLLPPVATALPPDLVGEVERFREQVEREGSMERKSDPPRQQEPVSEPPLAIAAPAPAPADAPVPRLRELPSAQRSEIPPHRLSVHVYSDSPAGRFVILNSAKMREGEQAADGLRVHAIRPDGVVLQHAQTRFFVPR